jgi:hypothetical protein
VWLLWVGGFGWCGWQSGVGAGVPVSKAGGVVCGVGTGVPVLEAGGAVLLTYMSVLQAQKYRVFCSVTDSPQY